MTPTTANRATIALRRRRVAEYRLRGFLQSEISEKLQDTDTPASVATVNRDVKALEAEWKASSLVDYAQLKANHLAELKEVRKVAWEGKDGRPELFYVLKSLEQEARVLGLEADNNNSSSEGMASAFLMGADTLRTLYKEQKAFSET